MMSLWMGMAVLAMIGALTVTLPVLRYRTRQTALSAETVNSLVFRDRLHELDVDRREGRVSADEFAQLRAELELTLLDDVALSQRDAAPVAATGKWLVWPLLLLVPALAFFLYGTEGYRRETADWIDAQARLQSLVPQLLAGNFTALEQAGVQLPDVVRALQVQVQRAPDDARSWYLLGASYMQMQRPGPAEQAFNRALSLAPDNLDYVLGYAQASVIEQGGLTPAVQQMLTGAIRQQPDNPKPYMILGMAAFQQGDFDRAVAVWQQYARRETADPRALQLLQRSIALAESQRRQNAPAQMPAPVLNVTVDVTPDMRAQLPAGAVLFVFARAAQGSPMPLAVVKQPVAQWPVNVQLSDANAMTPAATLSQQHQIQLQARISARGEALPQPGDWMAAPQTIALQGGEQAARLLIDQRQP